MPKNEVNMGRLRERHERHHDHGATADDAGLGGRASGSAPLGGADLENDDGKDEDPFRRVELVDTVKMRKENSGTIHVRAAKSTYILDAMASVGNAWDSSGNDHLI